MSIKTFITSLLTQKSLNVFRRLGIRYINRNKDKFIKQSFEFLNDDITNEIVSYLNYKHITDNTINSYVYIFIYELFYISVSMKFNPNQQNKIIEKGLIHLLLYILFKDNTLSILYDHTLHQIYTIDEYEAL